MVEALEHGILAGYPMSDVKVTVFDGDYHDVDSSEMAFKICGSICVKEALRKAKPVLLEPVMRGRSGGAGRIHGSGERRLDFAARAAGRHGDSGHDADHQGDGAAVGDVRLCDRVAFAHAGPRQRSPCTSAQYEEVPKNIAEEIVSRAQGKVSEVAVTIQLSSGDWNEHGERKI